METLNAIQYLKQNGFADNKSYNWINPILKKLLDNELKNEDIDDLISSIVKREKKISTSESEEAIAVSVENNFTNLFEISQIKEICEVSNFGLLDVKEAIKLNKNLNIFYGLNGVGKSSLYKAICSALNINKDRKCVPNIDGNDSKMVSKVKVIDKENNERVIEFPRDSNEVTTNVRVFDSYISNYISTFAHG